MGWNSFPFSFSRLTEFKNQERNKHNNLFTFVVEFTQVNLLFFIGDPSPIGKLERWDPHVNVLTGDFIVWTCKEIDRELVELHISWVLGEFNEGRQHLPCRWNKFRMNTTGVPIDKQEEDKKKKLNKNQQESVDFKVQGTKILGIWYEGCSKVQGAVEVGREPVKEKAECPTHSLGLRRPWLLSARNFTG